MQRPSLSPSPTRRSFSGALSAIGARINRTLTREDTLCEDDSDAHSFASSIDKSKTAADRSLSRGREVYSSGRGGAGNIRQPSASRTRPEDGPDDFSTSRGREPAPAQSPRSFSTGRGGVGNIRSPSRDVQSPLTAPELKEEERIVRVHVAAIKDAPHSSGRGGAGNITARSKSRDPQVPAGAQHLPHMRSTGRGGAGNIVSGDNLVAGLAQEEEERKNHYHRDTIHSTDRGGVATNVVSLSESPVERHGNTHGSVESPGRGGAGNIVRNQSAPRSAGK